MDNNEVTNDNRETENIIEPIKNEDNIKKEKKDIRKWFSDKINKISKKYKIIFVMGLVFILLLALAILFKKTISIVFAALFLIFLLVYVLLDKTIIKVKFTHSKLIVIILLVLSCCGYFGALGQNTNPKYKWNSIVLKNVIDRPDSPYGEITHNDQQYLSMYVYDIDEVQYKSYILSCIEKGFVNNTNKTESSFFSNNQDGYQLSIFFFKSEEKMALYLQAPKQLTGLTWPESSLAKMIPSIDSAIGSIIENNEKTLDLIIGNISSNDYKDYVQQCQQAGFDLALNLSTKNYSAENSAGYSLSVDYLSDNRMRIIIKAPNYNINLTVNCNKNSLFNKYDLLVYYDNELIGQVSHGQTMSTEIISDIGKHIIKFVSSDNAKIEKTVEIQVSEPLTVIYQLKCHANSIEIIE
ncbi:MAG: DUF6591 domain-containing protein [Erysipelotrichaceae bacterium]